ncbi:hexapaptide repeat-containing transferase [Pseudomonas saudimassiliensis]|uniref:Hexapaptide repeat-containing transferase n=1 Tax=Pseudomonas saudimassiliensis TaxID=1461581 RepID=A0A078MNA7_9PSED|nr:NeuD/PglB/VioB family sugar acetyltransferase [Pseudomonas saudimassiliensis]CEA06311.1 hexapaptide repeat-containing transferase [Pseudomonas saudimassiliensis]CEF27736.1 hexapaptide repeat-containing transferase [Pseudomonas saudimassiliensis]
MSNTIIAVYGASGFGREIMPLVKAQYSSMFSDVRFIFVDDGENAGSLNGYPILSYSKFLEVNATNKFAVLAIANSAVREKLIGKLESDEIDVLSVTADNVVMLDEVEVGEGAILCHFTQLTSNIKIGKQFHANIYSYVAHDCVIGDYVTFAPGVRCNGNIHIEDHAYIGTGAIIKQGTPDKPLVIGKGAVVGMGAVVTKDVPPGVTVVGNPAKPLVKA